MNRQRMSGPERGAMVNAIAASIFAEIETDDNPHTIMMLIRQARWIGEHLNEQTHSFNVTRWMDDIQARLTQLKVMKAEARAQREAWLDRQNEMAFCGWIDPPGGEG